MGGSLVAAGHPAPAGGASTTTQRAVRLTCNAGDVLRAAEGMREALGRLPEATNRAFIKAGLYRILQPRRFGGLELDLTTFFQAMASIARGCPSSGWVLALTAGHAHLLSVLFDER